MPRLSILSLLFPALTGAGDVSSIKGVRGVGPWIGSEATPARRTHRRVARARALHGGCVRGASTVREALRVREADCTGARV